MTRTSTDLLLQAPPERWLQYCPALLSALLAIVLYGVTLGGGYVFDDHFIVHDDPRLHQPRQWVAFWTHDYFDGGIDNLYRPLVSSSYAVQWWLHGDKPALFHAVNLVLHALVSASIAEFTRRVLIWKPGHRVIATCAGLLFAAHPIHVEAVANLVGRAEIACTLCIIAVLVLLSRGPPAMPKLIGVMTVAIAGMLCKEQAIIQPLLWLLLGIFIWEKFASGTEQRSRATRLVLMTSWIWAIYLIAREHLLKFEWDRSNLDPTIQPLVLSAGLDRILMPIVLLGHYTALLVWPAHLSVDYGADALGHVAHASDLYLWVGLTAVVCWVRARDVLFAPKNSGRSDFFVLPVESGRLLWGRWECNRADGNDLRRAVDVSAVRFLSHSCRNLHCKTSQALGTFCDDALGDACIGAHSSGCADLESSAGVVSCLDCCPAAIDTGAPAVSGGVPQAARVSKRRQNTGRRLRALSKLLARLESARGRSN